MGAKYCRSSPARSPPRPSEVSMQTLGDCRGFLIGLVWAERDLNPQACAGRLQRLGVTHRRFYPWLIIPWILKFVYREFWKWVIYLVAQPISKQAKTNQPTPMHHPLSFIIYNVLFCMCQGNKKSPITYKLWGSDLLCLITSRQATLSAEQWLLACS